MKSLRSLLSIAHVFAVACIICGCGRSGSNSKYNPREKALQTYLEIQRSVANGDYKTFEKLLGPDMQRIAKATPNGFQMFFGNLVSENGAKLAQVFNDDNYFMLYDNLSDYDTHPRIQEKIYFMPKNGKAQLVFPTPKQMKEIDDYRNLRIRIINARMHNDSKLPTELSKEVSAYLEKRMEELFIGNQMTDEEIKETKAIIADDGVEKLNLLFNYALFLEEKALPSNMPEDLATKLLMKYSQNDKRGDEEFVRLPFVVEIRGDIKDAEAFCKNPEAFKGPCYFGAAYKGDGLYGGGISLECSGNDKWGIRLQ